MKTFQSFIYFDINHLTKIRKNGKIIFVIPKIRPIFALYSAILPIHP